jgi:non-heme chloroperoxidase
VPYVASMAHRYQFVLPDLRGFGWSRNAPVRETNAMTQYVEDIDDLIDHLSCDDIKLGGLSMGGYVCLHKQQVNRFERISRCFVIDHPPKAISNDGWAYGMHPGVTQVTRQLVDYFKREQLNDPEVPFSQLPAVFRKMYRAVYQAIFVNCLPRLYEKWAAVLYNRCRFCCNALVPFDSWYAVMVVLDDYLNNDYDMREDVKEIAIPITIMIGGKSELFPNPGVQYLDEHIPESRLVRFERSGHALFLTEPLKFRRELQRFLTS